jgi:hypothetical protein
MATTTRLIRQQPSSQLPRSCAVVHPDLRHPQPPVRYFKSQWRIGRQCVQEFAQRQIAFARQYAVKARSFRDRGCRRRCGSGCIAELRVANQRRVQCCDVRHFCATAVQVKRIDRDCTVRLRGRPEHGFRLLNAADTNPRGKFQRAGDSEGCSCLSQRGELVAGKQLVVDIDHFPVRSLRSFIRSNTRGRGTDKSRHILCNARSPLNHE